MSTDADTLARLMHHSTDVQGLRGRARSEPALLSGVRVLFLLIAGLAAPQSGRGIQAVMFRHGLPIKGLAAMRALCVSGKREYG